MRLALEKKKKKKKKPTLIVKWIQEGEYNYAILFSWATLGRNQKYEWSVEEIISEGSYKIDHRGISLFFSATYL